MKGLSIILILLFLIVGLIVVCVSLQFAAIQKEQSFIAPGQLRKTEYDIVLACQTLAATKTVKDWGYKDCLVEMRKAINPATLKI